MTFEEEFPNKEVVEIRYDSPPDIDWLCPDNIQHALSQVCTNTKFIVKRIECLDKQKVREAMNKVKQMCRDNCQGERNLFVQISNVEAYLDEEFEKELEL